MRTDPYSLFNSERALGSHWMVQDGCDLESLQKQRKKALEGAQSAEGVKVDERDNLVQTRCSNNVPAASCAARVLEFMFRFTTKSKSQVFGRVT